MVDGLYHLLPVLLGLFCAAGAAKDAGLQQELLVHGLARIDHAHPQEHKQKGLHLIGADPLW